VSSPLFYSLPPIWKHIPSRARSAFISVVKPLLTNYTAAHSEGNIRKCNELLRQFVNIPRLFLCAPSSRSRRRTDPVNDLIYRLNHQHHSDNFNISSNGFDEERKRNNDIDTKAVKRAVTLVKMGDFKRAIKTLSNTTPTAPINDSTLNELSKLHPKQSHPLPPSPPSDAPTIIVSRKKLGRLIRRRMNNGAAGGPSGWTGKHLQPLVADTECMEGLSAIVEDICNGAITDSLLRNRLLACSLIPLTKPNGGIRPVAIGEILGKLASSYLLSVCMKPESYRELFPSIQEGVGIAGGCENVIHFIRAARRAIGEDTIVITVDFKNAYNMRKRIDMWNCILQHRNEGSVDLSHLIRFFHWAYAIPTPLVLPSTAPDSRRLITIESSEGVRQGANESSLLFSLSMQPIYEAALAGLSTKSVQAKAIQDDFTIVGKPAEALTVFRRLKELAEAQGMIVQPEKCFILPPSTQPFSPSTIETMYELTNMGVKETSLLHLLGATIAQDEDIDKMSVLVTDWANGICIAENERFFSLLTHRDMPVQIAFRLLVQSGLPRLSYLCRIMPPSAINAAIHNFDSLILKTLWKLFKVSTNSLSADSLSTMSAQVHLKMKNGGLGITPYSTIAPAAYIASFANASPAILSLFAEIGEENPRIIDTKKKYDELYHRIRQCIRDNSEGTTIDNLLPSSNAELNHLYSPRIPSARSSSTHPSPSLHQSASAVAHLQSKLTAAIEAKKVKEFKSSIDQSSNARILSASQPFASIWLSTLPEEHALRLSDDQFRSAIRHRLALSSIRLPKSCECDPSAGPINDSQHPHICPLMKKDETNQRHEYIVSCLFQLCRLAGISVSFSVPHLLRDYESGEGDIRPDLYVFSPSGETFMIDVSIVYPAGPSYVNRHHTDTRPSAAATHRAKEKVRKYDALARRNGMTFVPFIMESFGAFGIEARKFIKFISEQTADSFVFFLYCLRRLSIALQRGNALLQMCGAPRLFVDSSTTGYCQQQAPDIVPIMNDNNNSSLSLSASSAVSLSAPPPQPAPPSLPSVSSFISSVSWALPAIVLH
jgi:hypothetical protein